jgi:hypothetical protein
VREVCGDVTGDGRVTIVDVLRESAMTRVPHAAARYDLNGDGRVDEKDVATVARQVGRQC